MDLDPGILTGAAGIVLGAGAGLLLRQGIKLADLAALRRRRIPTGARR
jgi:hypothetical protein